MTKHLDRKLFMLVVVCNLQLCQTASLIPKRQGNDQLSNTIEVDIGQKRRITEINKDNFLHGGDILVKDARNGLVDADTRWSKTIPVQFNEQLSLLAIAAILDGFDDLELKTCFSFVNRSTETDYIYVEPLDGCLSYVGRQGDAQTLSIGSGCERIDVVQHEVLHALGLYHEQSRADRDDYVSVKLENVLGEHQHNFVKYQSSFVDHQRVPYDYNSIMHYSENAFSSNGLPSIVTINPDFQSVIGTGQALSSGDLTKLRRMYDCGDTHRYSYFCDFEDVSICGYVPQGTGWIHHPVTSSAFPQTDATFGEIGSGNILIASSSNITPSSLLVRTPLLESTVSKQCLEFSYYMRSSSATINLRVTLESTTSDLGVIFMLTGDQGDMWRKARVTMSASSEFKLLFTATAGSLDVVAIDDVNVIDRPCETGFFVLEDFSQTLSTSSRGDVVRSPIMYTDDGYAFRISVYSVGDSLAPDTSSMSVYFHIARGVNDDQLEWPFQNRYIKLSLLDQISDVLQQNNVVSNFLTDSAAHWEKPTTSFNTGWGYRTFVKVDEVRNKSYLKHDSIIISVQVTNMNNWNRLQASQTTTTTSTSTTTAAATTTTTTAAATTTTTTAAATTTTTTAAATTTTTTAAATTTTTAAATTTTITAEATTAAAATTTTTTAAPTTTITMKPTVSTSRSESTTSEATQLNYWQYFWAVLLFSLSYAV